VNQDPSRPSSRKKIKNVATRIKNASEGRGKMSIRIRRRFSV
jgi:hypothetical protein